MNYSLAVRASAAEMMGWQVRAVVLIQRAIVELRFRRTRPLRRPRRGDVRGADKQCGTGQQTDERQQE